jgi:hypothetical protein
MSQLIYHRQFHLPTLTDQLSRLLGPSTTTRRLNRKAWQPRMRAEPMEHVKVWLSIRLALAQSYRTCTAQQCCNNQSL